MENSRLCVIGGGISGVEAVMEARRENPELEILLFTDGEESDALKLGADSGVHVLTRHRVQSILSGDRKLIVLELDTEKTKEVEYDTLILATGAGSVIPPIEGRELARIFPLEDTEDRLFINRLIEQEDMKKAVVIGGGIHGLKMAEALILQGIPVTLIEPESKILPELDNEISALVIAGMEKRRVEFFTGEKILIFIGNLRGEVVEVHTNERIVHCDTVIWAANIQANTVLAEMVGAETGNRGGIRVDNGMESSIPGIFAVGDCAENSDAVDRNPMAAKIAGINAARGKKIRVLERKPDSRFWSLFQMNIGKAGLSAIEVEEAGMEYETVLDTMVDEWVIKLILDRANAYILGGQLLCEGPIQETMDELADLVLSKTEIKDMYDLPLTSPICHAVHTALSRREKSIAVVSCVELKQRASYQKLLLVDVRDSEETVGGRIPESLCIPYPELEERVEAWHRDQEIVLISNHGHRAALAFYVLKALGFQDVFVLEGGLSAYPYELE